MPTCLAPPTVLVKNNTFSQRQPSIVRTLLALVLLLVADNLVLPHARVLLLVADHPSSPQRPVHSTDALHARPGAGRGCLWPPWGWVKGVIDPVC